MNGSRPRIKTCGTRRFVSVNFRASIIEQSSLLRPSHSSRSPRSFTIRAGNLSAPKSSICSRVVSPLKTQTKLHATLRAIFPSVYRRSPTIAMWSRPHRSVARSTKLALGLPNTTSGRRPVVCSSIVRKQPQSGTKPSSVGHTRSPCVARNGNRWFCCSSTAASRSLS